MKINIRQAIKYFYKNPSLEEVFMEAIHNSIDAFATKIDIEISIDALDKANTLKIKITDNGVGFTDERYRKFCELMNVDEDTHRGVGRLVYLCYFNTINVLSKYNNKQRTFTYDDVFDVHQSDMQEISLEDDIFETSILFEDCSLKQLGSYSIIFPERLRKMIIEKFYPILYLLKQNKKELIINIKLDVKTTKKDQFIGSRVTQVSLSDLLKLRVEDTDLSTFELFAKSEIHYSIKKQEILTDPLLVTALCIDNRTYNLSDVISVENLQGYDAIFLLNSTAFVGQTDPSRETLTLNDTKKKIIIKLFRDKISEIIQREIPTIRERREKTQASLNRTYPHLIGYFEEDEIGIIDRAKSLEIAQTMFIRDQKDILEATNIDEKQYDKAIELSSRSLAEYILYREKIISRLDKITDKNSEADIHNLILPKETILKDNTDLSSVHFNNLWLLDEKYMTYSTAMSNKSMKEIIEEITHEDYAKNDTTSPDIVIIFSDNPKDDNNKDVKVDVVIVELKKRGIILAKTEEVISQLKQRARRLMKYYPNKIQRIWFYGIVEFNDEFRLSLKDEKYTPLYSKDYLYYKENEVYLDVNDNIPYHIGTYILSIDAFIKDAKARNATFLQILKDGFQKNKK